MTRILSALILFLVLSVQAWAEDVVVTRNFSSIWGQTQHESQGINLQIVHQATGEKVGVAYWFTYGDDKETAWFLAIGPASGNRVEMDLYEFSDVAFMQLKGVSPDPAAAIGTMDIEFSSCNAGIASFSTSGSSIGSGSFAVERITDLHNTTCSGGISDDSPASVVPEPQRIALKPTALGGAGSGHADFEERADRVEFSVEAEDIPNGTYRIIVGGVDRGPLQVSLGEGETEFRSPAEDGKILLNFDPRGQLIEVRNNQGVFLTSDGSVLGGGNTGGDDNGGNGDDDPPGDDNGGNGDDDPPGDDNGGNGDDDPPGDDNGGNGDDDPPGDDNGGDDNGGSTMDFGSVEIEVDLENTGVFPLASGDARLRPRSDRTDFSVEVEDLPVGSYGLRIGGDMVGTIQVVTLQDGSVEGELEFRNPVEPGKTLLDFDPRGKLIEVLQDSTVVLEVDFPSS